MIEFIQAQQPPMCFPHAELAAALAEHGEVPVANGIADSGAAFIIFATRDGSTWTLVVRRGAASCIGTMGKDWTTIHVEPPKQPGRGI